MTLLLIVVNKVTSKKPYQPVILTNSKNDNNGFLCADVLFKLPFFYPECTDIVVHCSF